MDALHELIPGSRARILGFRPCVSVVQNNYRRKLMAMGLTPNTDIEILGLTPMDGPVHIKVRNASLCLRKDEAVLLKLAPV
jgi:ferrous iron transport protein A